MVESGVIHELATSVAAGDGGTEPLAPAKGPAPDNVNRLRDVSHISEKLQVIASLIGHRWSFQIVNTGVRIVYRITPDDAAALAATHRGADVPTLVHSTTSRVLMHVFVSQTLDEVLGEQRADLAEQAGQAIRADLNHLGNGVEVLDTAVEATHLPAGVASAYHAMQVAQITAWALIARERGQAVAQHDKVQLQAGVAHDRAGTQARETLAAMQVADRCFAAGREGYADAGQAFLLGVYYHQLGSGLGKINLLLIDHRIAGAGAPTIGLRSFGPGRLDFSSSSHPSVAPASATE